MSERLVYLEMREKVPRWKWIWWVWKRVNSDPAPESSMRVFCQMAIAPYVLMGAQFRFKAAK